MLGWNIRVHRQADGGARPAGQDSAIGQFVAVWQTGLGGLNWLDDLVREGEAIDLGGNGYPCRYTAQAQHLVRQILDGPPEANECWLYDPHDILGKDWPGRTMIDPTAAGECRPEEWLLVEAWDES